MTAAYRETIILLEQEIEAIEQRRGDLLRAIETLRPLAGDDAPTRTRSPRALKRNERTNERAKRGPRLPRQRSLPDDEAILAQLKEHGTMKPGALAKALGLSVSILRSRLKLLVKAGRIVVTGKTMNRQVSLPQRRAKEVP